MICNNTVMKIRVVTWNVCARPLDFNTLSWCKSPDCDVFIIGIQEIISQTNAVFDLVSCHDLIFGNVLNTWITQLNTAIGNNYTLLAAKRCYGIALVAFCTNSIRHCFKNVNFEFTGIGLFGVYGNKGALTLSTEYQSDSGPVYPAKLTLDITCV
jgi:hypothetical protein